MEKGRQTVLTPSVIAGGPEVGHARPCGGAGAAAGQEHGARHQRGRGSRPGRHCLKTSLETAVDPLVNRSAVVGSPLRFTADSGSITGEATAADASESRTICT